MYRRQVGLFDFLNQLPEYAAKCYELYRYCRISAVDVKLIAVGEMTSASTNFAIEAGMARIPYDEALSTEPTELRAVRGGKYSLIAQAGFNRLALTGTYGSFDELGNPVYDRTFWQTAIDASSPTPVDGSRPVVAIAVKAALSNAVTATVNLSVTYHMQFFDLESPRITSSTTEIGEKSQIVSRPTPKAKLPLRVEAEEFTPLVDPDDYSRVLRHRETVAKPMSRR